MQTAADYRAMDLGNDICTELQRRGHKITRLEVGASRIYIQVDLMGADRPWTKAFFMPAPLATPHGFEAKIKEWKRCVHRDLRGGTASKVVREAIGHWGEGRVQAMLEAA